MLQSLDTVANPSGLLRQIRTMFSLFTENFLLTRVQSILIVTAHFSTAAGISFVRRRSPSICSRPSVLLNPVKQRPLFRFSHMGGFAPARDRIPVKRHRGEPGHTRDSGTGTVVFLVEPALPTINNKMYLDAGLPRPSLPGPPLVPASLPACRSSTYAYL
jgi:hypothetical protein